MRASRFPYPQLSYILWQVDTFLASRHQQDYQGQPLAWTLGIRPPASPAKYAREWNTLEQATRYLEEELKLARQWAIPGTWLGRIHVILALMKQAQGANAEAFALIYEAEQFIQSQHVIYPMITSGTARAQLELARGNITSVLRWSQTLEQVEMVLDHARERDYLLLARVYFLQDRQKEALALLGRLRQRAEKDERARSIIKLMAVQALFDREQGHLASALHTLSIALALAEPEGYVRTFVEEGAPMAALLESLLETRQRAQAALHVPLPYACHLFKTIRGQRR